MSGTSGGLSTGKSLGNFQLMSIARRAVAVSLVSAFAVAIPALSEPKQITAPAAKPAASPEVPSAQVQHPTSKLPQKSFPVSVPEAKAEAAAALKPPETWSAAEITDAKARCTAILKRIHAVAIAEAPIKQGVCGTPAPIQLISVGRNPEVALSPPAIVTCEMAEALHNWMKSDVQPLAKKRLGAEVIKIETMSSYSCRNAYGRKGGKLSEHGVANALDIRGFVTATGKTAYVLEHWGTPQREILARIAAEKAKAEKLAAERAAAEKAAQANQMAVKSKGTSKAPPGEPPSAEASATGTPGSGLAKNTITDGTSKITVTLPGASDEHLAESGDETTFSIAPSKLGGPKAGQKSRNQKAAVGLSALPLANAAGLSEPARREAFLHDVHQTACQLFGTTLGPEANAAHRNHFHIDLASRKTVKICD